MAQYYYFEEGRFAVRIESRCSLALSSVGGEGSLWWKQGKSYPYQWNNWKDPDSTCIKAFYFHYMLEADPRPLQDTEINS